MMCFINIEFSLQIKKILKYRECIFSVNVSVDVEAKTYVENLYENYFLKMLKTCNQL